jgi:superfamily II DNA/RNA helicase
LGEAERRLLIATDCLSEGVNLQEHFSAVVHYDLSWNPTRHEQREGRVDRFGQERSVVRATLMYGRNNPVDAVVLQVILRKAKKIRDELGVPVPCPTTTTR